MGIKKLTRTIAGGGSVALATAGLSSCIDNGAVDPAPEPLVCGDVEDGQTLAATATLDGSTLTVEVRTSFVAECGGFRDVAVTDLESVTVQEVRDPQPETAGPAVIVFDLDDGATSGAFTLHTTFFDGCGDVTCETERRFTFSIEAGEVQVSRLDGSSLPLRARHPAAIAVLKRTQQELELVAKTAFPKGYRVQWSATAGKIAHGEGGRVVWHLPGEKGFYQIQAAIDYGDAGLAFDALTVEVA